MISNLGLSAVDIKYYPAFFIPQALRKKLTMVIECDF